MRIDKKATMIVACVLFVVCECVLFVAIQLTQGVTYEVLAYLSVVLACSFSFLTLVIYRGGWLVRAGLCFTLLADYFLILAEPIDELWGVIVFSAVQMCYFAHLMLTHSDKKMKMIHVSVRILLIAAAMPIAYAVLGSSADALSLWSLFYYANLVCNIVFAFVVGGHEIVLALGLLLLAMCDAALGLAYLGSSYLGASEGSFLYMIGHTGLNLPWIFYVPSQTLVALSLCIGRNTEKHNI